MSDEGTLAYVAESILFVLAVGVLSVAVDELLSLLVKDENLRFAILAGVGPWITALVEKASGWSP